MAGKKQSRQRKRELVADKIAKGELLEPADAEWLSREGMKQSAVHMYEPFTTETAKAASLRAKEVAAVKRQAKDEAYRDFAEDALGPAAQIQMLAMQKVLDKARVMDPETGEFVMDPSQVPDKELRTALATAKEMVERIMGKSTTKIEGDLTMNFVQRLAQDGEL